MHPEEAREKVRTAIQDYLVAIEMMDPAEQLINHWGVVVNVEQVNNDGMARYAGFYHTNDISPHVAIGLLRMGIEAYSLNDRNKDD